MTSNEHVWHTGQRSKRPYVHFVFDYNLKKMSHGFWTNDKIPEKHKQRNGAQELVELAQMEKSPSG